MDHRFGFKPSEPDPYIERLVTRVVRIRPILSQLILIGMYHKQFKICDHDSPYAPPMPELAFHELEDTENGNLLFELPQLYLDKKIQKYFNLSFTEFIHLPKFYIDHLAKIAERQLQKDVEEAERLQRIQENKTNQIITQRGPNSKMRR